MDIDKRLLKQLINLQKYVDDIVEDGYISAPADEFEAWYGICGNCTRSVWDRLAELNLNWPLSTGNR